MTIIENDITVFLMCAYRHMLSTKSPTTPIKISQTYRIWCLVCAHEHTLDKPMILYTAIIVMKATMIKSNVK